MSDGNPPQHVVAVFEAAARRLRHDLAGRLAPDAPGLSPSQLRLLGITPERGARMTDLAARASITKQALGELVTALRASGHLETVPDAQDRRVKLVRPTAEGRRVRHRVDEEITALEAAYAEQLGTRRFATLLAALRELGTTR